MQVFYDQAVRPFGLLQRKLHVDSLRATEARHGDKKTTRGRKEN
jgi:hypothetical protein